MIGGSFEFVFFVRVFVRESLLILKSDSFSFSSMPSFGPSSSLVLLFLEETKGDERRYLLNWLV